MLASEEGHYSVELVDNTGILHSCCVCVCVCVCARARAHARVLKLWQLCLSTQNMNMYVSRVENVFIVNLI